MKKAAFLFGSLIVLILLTIASGIRLDVPIEKLFAKYTNQQSKFVTIDGMSVHYRDEGNGPPLVLLHNMASSLHSFDKITVDLSKKFRVIRLDLPGYGLTGPNKTGDYSLKSYVIFLDAFLTRIGVNSCYLAGNSFGGRIAIEFAYEKPDRVTKLILADALGYPLGDDGVLAVKMARLPLFRPMVRYITPRYFVGMNIQQAYGADHKVTEETIDRYYDFLLREGNRDTFIAMCNLKEEDITSHIKALRMPILILWGNRDTIIPVQHAELFHRDIPGSRLIVYEGVGHLPQEIVPEKVAADMAEFL